jgi:hypothetical protein
MTSVSAATSPSTDSIFLRTSTLKVVGQPSSAVSATTKKKFQRLRTSCLDYSTQIVVTERVTQRSMMSLAFPIDVNDLWWNPLESGAGLSIGQDVNDQVFAVWNVYDAGAQPTWYTLQPGRWISINTYTGLIYRTTGPYWGGTFDRTLVDATQVGAGTLTFLDSANGRFSYTVDGVSGVKPITRLLQR